jgi:uncharacterized membrane protein
MRAQLIAVLLVLPALALLNAAWGWHQLRRFAAEVPEISSTYQLRRFQELAARQMYFALAQIPLLLGPCVAFIWGLKAGHLTMGDVLWVIGPGVIVIAAAQAMKPLERRVQSTPATDSELADARDNVVRTWVHRPLPDWK